MFSEEEGAFNIKTSSSSLTFILLQRASANNVCHKSSKGVVTIGNSEQTNYKLQKNN